MSLYPWLRQLSHRLSSRRRRHDSNHQRVRLCLEVLEDRAVPTVASIGAVDPLPSNLQLTNAAITPDLSSTNLLNWNAQVTLTVQVSNPAGTVNEGTVSANLLGISAQGNVVNGTASVQLAIPLFDLTSTQNVQLNYTDVAPDAAFGFGSVTTALPLNLLNATSASNLTFSSAGDVTNSIQNVLGPVDYVYVNQQWSQLNFGPLNVQVQSTNLNGNVLTTLDGVPWQLLFFSPQDQYLGAATVALNDSGPVVWLSDTQGVLVGVGSS